MHWQVLQKLNLEHGSRLVHAGFCILDDRLGRSRVNFAAASVYPQPYSSRDPQRSGSTRTAPTYSGCIVGYSHSPLQ